MTDNNKNVLVLCTGNSCRSIMGEALFNALPGFTAVSAGSTPAGYVHPKALATIARHGLAVDDPKSQSWDEFANDSFDYVVTVCDSAANEACPAFTGPAERVHWSIPDPAKATGTDAQIDAEFESAFALLRDRIHAQFG